MSSKKKIILIFAVLLITSFLFAVGKPAYAANGWFGGGNFFSRLIEFISQKFGLDKTQVQNAVKDFQQQRKANISPRPTLTEEEKAKITPRPTMNSEQWKEMEKRRLDKLVTENKITTDQENAILVELEAVRAKYPFNPQDNLTPEERKTQMENMQNELKSWAESNGIDPSYVTMEMGGGFGGSNGGFGGDKPGESPREPEKTRPPILPGK